jgi:hypothetical protein
MMDSPIGLWQVKKMQSSSCLVGTFIVFTSRLAAPLAMVLAFSSCVHGPKRENDNVLSYLNGENYQAPAEGIPLAMTRQSPVTHISGVLNAENTPLPEPLKYQTLVLSRGQSELARVMTDAQGQFIFSGEIPNGSYSITLISEHFKLNSVLNVSAYKTEGLKLIATSAQR